jgi:hypothetical protein
MVLGIAEVVWTLFKGGGFLIIIKSIHEPESKVQDIEFFYKTGTRGSLVF